MIRFLGCAVAALVVAVTIGLSSTVVAPAPASAKTVTDVYPSPPSPLPVFVAPLALGLQIIDAIAEGIANAVEMIATPAPIAIPAPHAGS